MVCTANDLQEWKNFPKGLRVLLFDRDIHSAADIRSKLENMEYIVSSYGDEKGAFSAILSTTRNFHIAILEVCEDSFKFLETCKDLPIIMTSNIHCLHTMLKCISLGAVEFLLKPLSEDKLKNIWQHVIHKAFSNSPNLIKESAVPMMQLELVNEDESEISFSMEDLCWVQDDELEQPAWIDKLPDLEAEQLIQEVSLVDSWETQDQIKIICSSMETDCSEKDEQFKLVETTSIHTVYEDHLQGGQPQLPEKTMVDEEDQSFAAGLETETNNSHHHKLQESTKVKGTIADLPEHSIKGSDANCSVGSKHERKKTKVEWTAELHKKFVQAVGQLGLDQAIPSKILELMKVDGLTRHNVASHLQKYRMQKRHVMNPRWSFPTVSMQNYNHLRPIMGYPPPYHSNNGVSMSPVYPTWRQSTCHQASAQIWGPCGFHHWQPPGIQHRNSYSGVQADAWGCPVMPPLLSHASYYSYPQLLSASQNMYTVNDSHGFPHGSFDLQQDEEMIDRAVTETMRKPWSKSRSKSPLPLPLGLKPPSIESVLSELSRQGISTVPRIYGSKHL